MDFQRFITQLKITINNDLPGEESHQKMRVIYDPSIELPFSKINSTPASGTRLLETKAYENPQFSRIKDLMSKL